MELTLTGATLIDPLHNGKKHSITQPQPQPQVVSPLFSQEQNQNLHHDHSHNHVHGECKHHGQGHGHSIEEQKLLQNTKTMESFSIPTVAAERQRALFQLLMYKFSKLEDFQKLVTFLVTNGEESALHSWVDKHSLAHWAVKRCDTRALEILQPYNLNFHQPTRDDVEMYPIHWAATEGSIKAVAWLLSNIQSDKGVTAILNARDKSGCTPLLIAAQYGFTDLVAFLIHQGADPSVLDNNKDSALHWGAYRGDSYIVGLLHYLGSTNVDARDAFGQTPLHLASLRGMTEVVQYLLYDANSQALYIKDKEGKTPFDLAIKKNKKSVQLVLETFEKNLILSNSSISTIILHFVRQLISPYEWKIWLTGGGTGDVGHGANNRFPFILNVFSTLLAGSLFPLRYFVEENYDKMADKSGFLITTLMTYGIQLFCFIMIYTTNPGVLAIHDEKGNKRSQRRSQHCTTGSTKQLSSQTMYLQEKYKEMLEDLGKEIDGNHHSKPSLCHSCHIVRPTRSKHCRVMRRCVLMFDHFCPFVGNTIGLNNYLYFYLYCIFFVVADILLCTTSVLFYDRVGFDWYTVIVSMYIGVYLFPSGFMTFYHTQLIWRNLTTNEHENAHRYDHFKNENGRFHNPFDQGLLHNCYIRCVPSKISYELPQRFDESKQLLSGDNLA